MINGDKVNIGSPNKKITIGAQNFFRTIRTEDSSFSSRPSQISINFLNLWNWLYECSMALPTSLSRITQDFLLGTEQNNAPTPIPEVQAL